MARGRHTSERFGARRSLATLQLLHGTAIALAFSCDATPDPNRDAPGPVIAQPLEDGGADATSPLIEPDAGMGGMMAVACGNDVLEAGEECDDGNRASSDGCSRRCTTESSPGPRTQVICGDNRIAAAEECDDGNTTRGDGCDNRCFAEGCGNHRVDLGEDCDPPVPGQCDPTCRGILLNCGDGELQSAQHEECDDGNQEPGDGCSSCRIECGDGVLERVLGEECEPVHALPGTCTEDCHRVPACGDGVVSEAAGEECDPSDEATCVDCRLTEAGPDIPGNEDAGAPIAEDCRPLSPHVSVKNAAFETTVEEWAASEGASATHSDDGARAPGSIAVTWTPGDLGLTTFDGAVQCIPVRTGTRYTMRVRYKNPEGEVSGVRAAILGSLYEGTECAGTSTVTEGPSLVAARDAWFVHERALDTTTLSADDGEARLLLKLGAIVPDSVDSGRALFDDVEIERVGTELFCGDCIVSTSSGEECDDGNASNGDGCGSTCRLECGNGTDDGPLEDCDDGNRTFGDGCTPQCSVESSCDACAKNACASQIDPCLGLQGTATLGPRAGTPRNILCAELRSCVHETGCHGDTAIAQGETLAGAGQPVMENCYCGTSGVRCLEPGRANGSCHEEVEAALETTNPVELLQRFGGADPSYPAFAALAELLWCEEDRCTSSCVTASTCGDGHVQDRTRIAKEEIRFRIDGLVEPCLDEYTATGLGCSFEECDDGNLEAGDGCDASCFLEECGNYVKQGTEDCDDGNRENGDGCSQDCVAEFICGDGLVDPRFEDCDPPDSGPLCSTADHAENASACGCDADCAYKVCGNGVVQEGEDCDPPNGATCGAACLFTIDRCTECVLQLENCGGNLLLSGYPEDPQLARGCLDNPVCYNLWSCYHTTGCHYAGTYPSPYGCYCGGDQPPSACFQGSPPLGACKEEMLAAFEAQWESPPLNAQQLDGLSLSRGNEDFTPTALPYFQASYLQQTCLASSETFRASLAEETTLGDAELNTCVDACFH